MNLSRTYLAMREFARAESLLVPAAQAHPEWIDLQRDLGDYWLTRGRIPDAIVQFERVLAKEPRDDTLWRAVIWAHLYLGEREKAILRLNSAPPGTVNDEFKRQLAHDGLTLPADDMPEETP
jgi:tetratricopeptide (TPR) repeat protein